MPLHRFRRSLAKGSLVLLPLPNLTCEQSPHYYPQRLCVWLVRVDVQVGRGQLRTWKQSLHPCMRLAAMCRATARPE